MTRDKEKLIEKDIKSIENRVRHAFNQGYEAGLKHGKEHEPKTGHWIGIDEEPHEDYECDNCGYVVSTYTANIEPHTEYKFCPNCGAKMVEPQESEDKK